MRRLEAKASSSLGTEGRGLRGADSRGAESRENPRRDEVRVQWGPSSVERSSGGTDEESRMTIFNIRHCQQQGRGANGSLLEVCSKFAFTKKSQQEESVSHREQKKAGLT